MPDLTDRDLILSLATAAYALDRDGPTRLARPLTAAIRRAVAVRCRMPALRGNPGETDTSSHAGAVPARLVVGRVATTRPRRDTPQLVAAGPSPEGRN
jgi:hypothetical protein